MSGKRTSLASLAGEKVETVPGQSEPLLLTLPTEKLAPCRFNSRQNFGSEEQLRDFGAKLRKKQLQPAVVVARTSYLKLWPEETGNVGAKPYVIVNGERRYRASVLVGRHLEVVVRDDLAESRAVFLDSIMSENEDREDLDPIERALGIQTMVEQLGGAVHVAKYYGKSEGWVSQQRKLLKLTKPLQEAVSAGELAPRLGRELAGLEPELQEQAWADELARRARSKEDSAATRAARSSQEQAQPPAQSAPVFTAVKTEASTEPAGTAAPPAAAEEARHFTAQVPKDPVDGTGDDSGAPDRLPSPTASPVTAIRSLPESEEKAGLPEPRQAGCAPGVDEPAALDLAAGARHIVQGLIARLDPAVLLEVAELLQQHNRMATQSREGAQIP